MDPWRRVSSYADEELLELRRLATRIMTDGVLEPRAITYRGPGPQGRWAYGREGQPCRRCGTAIQQREQGDDRRITWWCPVCQT
jgi:endonuclease VIII